MGPIVAAATIGAAGGLLGGFLGNRASADEAARNRQFQRRMYKHRYQYTVEDMRKAGLNPALAYQQGGGSAPSGSMASQDDPIKGGVEALTRGISSALAIRQNKAQVANIEAQTAKTQAETRQLQAESESRAEYWRQRPAGLGSEIELRQSHMRANQLAIEFAEKTLGDRVAIQGLNREEMVEILRQLRQEIELRGLERAPLEVQAKFAESWYGTNVAPYISSAGGALGIIGRLIMPFLKYGQGKAGPNQAPQKMRPQVNRRSWQ